MDDAQRLILTLSCPDAEGIVASVSTYLFEEGGFIEESTQYGDASTQRFFMRVQFTVRKNDDEMQAFESGFKTRIGAPRQMDYAFHRAAQKTRMLVLVSGHMHCLNDIMYRYRTGQTNVEIPAVISNHDAARGMVEWHGIAFHHFPMDAGKQAQEARILDVIEKERIDLVVLARYMQILSPEMCATIAGRAINIHHSFLPSFKGAKPYHQAYERGVKLIGATAHFVTNDLDEGPIIEQEVERVDHTRTPEALAQIGHDIESLVLSRAIKLHTEHRVLMNGQKTVVFR